MRTGVHLKRWTGIFKNADVGTLFRTRESFGLQLTSPSHYFKKMQIIKSHILKNSLDPDIQRLFSHRSLHESTFYHKNLGSHFLSEIEKIVDHKLKFKGQTHKQGLGHGHFIQPKTFADKRKIITDTLRDEESDKYLSHSHTLALQGVWTHWISTVSPFDISWKNIIYNIQPKILSFVLNSMINSLATPDMLKL